MPLEKPGDSTSPWPVLLRSVKVKFSSITSAPFPQACFTGLVCCRPSRCSHVSVFVLFIPQGLSAFLQIKCVLLAGKSGYLFVKCKDRVDSGSEQFASSLVGMGGTGWRAPLGCPLPDPPESLCLIIPSHHSPSASGPPFSSSANISLSDEVPRFCAAFLNAFGQAGTEP